MILRSRKITARPSKEPNSSKKRAESIEVQTTQSPKTGQRRSPAVHNVNAQDDAGTPSSKIHTIKQTKKLQDFLNNEGDCSPTNQTEMQQNSSPDCPYFSPLPKEDVTEAFNPYKFICSAQAASGYMQKRKNGFPCKTRSVPESTLVLDLEEVLVESSLLTQPDAQFTFLTPFQDTYYKVYLKLRPHVKEFLERLCKMYEIFVFTTAKKEYAEKILEILDPQKKLIRHRLYQDHCVCVLGHYVKDLNILDRDLAKTVALDTLAHTLPFHLTNRIPVKRWSGNQADEELLTLLPILEQMTHVEDVRLVISQKFHSDDLVAS